MENETKNKDVREEMWREEVSEGEGWKEESKRRED
jgi:hypothetical protein